ncbi:TPA: hypothetical protein PJH62_002427 [Acinetobacter nosocomialis]|uniref:hypothetical protein n=1 Tax=Acinetobacter calcoaceticus/baumannii complex TaxID=909768 RepID=UPI0002AE99F2|nr:MULTISPECIES: hypothetical protein [Acinetobacter calcoaceticus/baumannii complex]ELW81470.1 hypothetical protein ACIN5021_1514 [Acinetobacter sp. OIFC021]EXE48928.1 hypothetical protein J576_2914 [Acinetobacter sp. 766875]MDE1666578.1 hypothetical protein [Acinetobacter nosocomialis]MDE9416901.1 hypothetical protein [Acinetobacter nosocomialis]HDH7779869.1 hypothetical protein [Acinetobacter nosocomialis]
MPQYLAIAESVYRKVKEVELFSDDTIENLNNLMIFIRKEITGSIFKLKYNYIDFEEALTKPLSECKVKIDVSLIPHHSMEDEYILWLAGFVEKITEGGPKAPPPIKRYIPEFISLESELDFLTVPKEKVLNKGEEITDYFNSEAFTKTVKK